MSKISDDNYGINWAKMKRLENIKLAIAKSEIKMLERNRDYARCSLLHIPRQKRPRHISVLGKCWQKNCKYITFHEH